MVGGLLHTLPVKQLQELSYLDQLRQLLQRLRRGLLQRGLLLHEFNRLHQGRVLEELPFRRLYNLILGQDQVVRIKEQVLLQNMVFGLYSDLMKHS
jgi:hypothetical protein